MNSNMTKLRATLLAMSVAAVSANGADLTLTGDAPATWDNSSVNWRNETGELQKFSTGDNALIDDSVFTGGTVSFGAKVTPCNLVIDNARSLVLQNSANAYGLGADTVSWTKKGAGTLTVAMTGTGSTDGNANNCRFDVEGGKVQTGAAGYNLFGRRGSSTTHIALHPGSSFDLYHGNANGGLDGYPTLKVTVETNATFNVDPKVGGNGGTGSIGSLVVNGGSVTLANGNADYGTLFVYNGLVDIGPAPAPFVLQPSTAQSISFQSSNNGGEIRVADITGNEQADATFYNQFCRKKDGAVGLRKTGPGRMVYAPLAMPDERNQLNRDIVVEEGELELASTGALNPKFARNVRVNTNATLRISAPRGMAASGTVSDVNACYAAAPAQTNIIDHGKLILGPDTGNYADVSLGSLILDHATLDYSGLGGSSAGLMICLGNLFKFVDDKPLNMERYPNNNIYRAGLNLNPLGMTEINVCKTGDANEYDLCISLNIKNGRIGSTWSDSGIVKTGPGTLCLDGWYKQNDTTVFNNSFTGDIEVREGVLQIAAAAEPYRALLSNGNSYVGNINTARNRTITVQPGATLYFKTRAVMGMPSSANGFTNEVKNVTVVVNGGTFRTETAQMSAIPNLTLNDGTYEYGEGFWNMGVLFVPGTLKVTGTKPCVFPKTASCQYMGLNGYPETVFDVDDVTKNDAADLTFDIPLGIDGSQWDGAIKRYNHKYGFIKRGEGTMRLAFGMMSLGTDVGAKGQCINFDGDVKVEAGVLRVDGNVANSDTILVSSGAAVAGTGTVHHVSIAAGGGFASASGSLSPLRVNGDLTLGETGFVDLSTDSDILNKAKLATVVNGAITAPSDLSGWKVRVNGVERPGRVWIRDKSLFAGPSRGFMMTVR